MQLFRSKVKGKIEPLLFPRCPVCVVVFTFATRESFHTPQNGHSTF